MAANKQRQARRERGTPYIGRADNGVWYIYWSEGRRSRRQSTGYKDEVQAQKTFANWLLIQDQEKSEAGVAYTVAELWGVYDKKHVQTDAVMDNGRKTIGHAWKNLEPHFGLLRAASVDQGSVDGYAAARRKAGAAPATIRREVATLFAALRFCASKKGGKLCDVSELSDIQLPPDSEPRDRWLTIEQVQKLLDAAAAMRRGERLSRIERFIWLALFTTSRKQALLELTWDRVDFSTSTIHLNVPGRRITKKRRADVSIATQLRPVLERAYKERTGNLVLDHGADDIWAGLQYVAIRAGFSDQKVGRGKSPKATGVSPHVLRHSGATHMARGDVALWKIAKTLGNTTAVVERVYAKWQPGDPGETVDVISSGQLEAAE